MEKKLKKYKSQILDCITSNYKFDGFFQTKIDYLSLYTCDQQTNFLYSMYEPSLCIVLQGSKAVGFDDNLYSYNPSKFLLSCAFLPTTIKIEEASIQKPFYSLKINLNLEKIYEIIKNVDDVKFDTRNSQESGLFFGDMNEDIYELLLRLVNLCDKDDKQAKYLSELILQELLYILVLDPQSGAFLNNFATTGTISNKITKAIVEIKSNFTEKLNIKELADMLEMSESSLYQGFKVVTSFSPIQYQKKIRLEEAKNMLRLQKAKVADVAFAVGYESQSQFSREYTRMFGISPKAHISYMQTAEIE